MKELLCGSCRWNFGGLCWFGWKKKKWRKERVVVYRLRQVLMNNVSVERNERRRASHVLWIIKKKSFFFSFSFSFIIFYSPVLTEQILNNSYFQIDFKSVAFERKTGLSLSLSFTLEMKQKQNCRRFKSFYSTQSSMFNAQVIKLTSQPNRHR